MKTNLSSLRQPSIPTAPLNPIMRALLVAASILSSLYFGLSAISATIMSYFLTYALLNLAYSNIILGSISTATFWGATLLNSILSVLSIIFVVRLIKKRPLSQAQLITYLVLLIIVIIARIAL